MLIFALSKKSPLSVMITFEEATEIILSQSSTGSTEHIDFAASLGRVLAQSIVSDMDMPPFDKSAMDGYACRRDDLPGPLEIIEEIPAGQMPEKSITKGVCSAIMTGAPLPVGADCVIMQEHTEMDPSGRVLLNSSSARGNICYKGEDVKTGMELIEKGTLITPRHIAIMAAAGATRIAVSVMPRVIVFTTGNELVEPHIQPVGSAIRNSNGYQITAQLQACGFHVHHGGIVQDTPEATATAIEEGFAGYDVVVLTGGVSKGTYDFVPQVMSSCGVEVLFHHLAVQPGKPALFGRKGNHQYIFGLPGNPVSCFVQTELFVKMLCYRMQGHHYTMPQIKLPMGVPYHRKRTERKAFVPVEIRESKIYPVRYHGSANIQALHGANGFLVLERGIQQLNIGDPADVRLF
jgi:molybdopterin molybdotransferase